MQKKFYYKLVYIKAIIISLFFISCKSPLGLVNNSITFKTREPLRDTEVLAQIDNYANSPNYNPEVGLIVLYSKENVYKSDVKEYYISFITNLRDIYDFPCSGYFIHNGKVILIYSKEIGYNNPVNYPKTFLNKIYPKLVDDWTIVIKNCEDKNMALDVTLVSNHSKTFHIKDKTLNEIHFHSNLSEVCFGQKEFVYTDYINLDNFRTKYLKDCDE